MLDCIMLLSKVDFPDPIPPSMASMNPIFGKNDLKRLEKCTGKVNIEGDVIWVTWEGRLVEREMDRNICGFKVKPFLKA